MNVSPLKDIITHGSVNKPTIAEHHSYFQAVYCEDTCILLSSFCISSPIKDHQESFPVQDGGVIHAEASVKLDAIIFDIEPIRT
jgi:hypothetical protein